MRAKTLNFGFGFWAAGGIVRQMGQGSKSLLTCILPSMLGAWDFPLGFLASRFRA